MKISEKQLIMLFDLAIWLSKLKVELIHCPFKQELIIQLVETIYNQQSNELKDIE